MDAECEEGELCGVTYHTAGSICVSKFAEATTSWIEAIKPPGAEEDPKPSPSAVTGLTLDSCSDSDDCTGLRRCAYTGVGNNLDECDGRSPCKCLKPGLGPCFKDTDCETGEFCVETGLHRVPVCISKNADLAGYNRTSIDTGNGLTMDSCDKSEECKGDRDCISYWDIPLWFECFKARPCVCLPNQLPLCSSSEDCGAGEKCVISVLISDSPICIAESFAETFAGSTEYFGNGPIPGATNSSENTGDASPEDASPEPSPSGEDADIAESSSEPSSEPLLQTETCVDSSALQHLRRDELVFEKDVWSEVLCDEGDSCATAGHIVLHHGKAMMMKSYCEVVGCKKKRMFVNSPRYTVGCRISSRTDGLQYSSFAARYETRGEEMLMAVAIHSGL